MGLNEIVDEGRREAASVDTAAALAGETCTRALIFHAHPADLLLALHPLSVIEKCPSVSMSQGERVGGVVQSYEGGFGTSFCALRWIVHSSVPSVLPRLIDSNLSSLQRCGLQSQSELVNTMEVDEARVSTGGGEVRESSKGAPVHGRSVGNDPHHVRRQTAVERPSTLLSQDQSECLHQASVLGHERALRDRLTETRSEDLSRKKQSVTLARTRQESETGLKREAPREGR